MGFLYYPGSWSPDPYSLSGHSYDLDGNIVPNTIESIRSGVSAELDRMYTDVSARCKVADFIEPYAVLINFIMGNENMRVVRSQGVMWRMVDPSWIQNESINPIYGVTQFPLHKLHGVVAVDNGLFNAPFNLYALWSMKDEYGIFHPNDENSYRWISFNENPDRAAYARFIKNNHRVRIPI